MSAGTSRRAGSPAVAHASRKRQRDTSEDRSPKKIRLDPDVIELSSDEEDVFGKVQRAGKRRKSEGQTVIDLSFEKEFIDLTV